MATIKPMSDLKSAFREAVLKDMREEAKVLLKDLEEQIKKQLSKTIAFSEPRGLRTEEGFRYAAVMFSERSISVSHKAVVVKIRGYVGDTRNGQPHEIWHKINGGVDAFVAKSTIRYKQRKRNRTASTTLQSRPFNGYEGWRTIKKGKTRSAIEPRDFYKKVFDLVAKKIYDNSTSFEMKKSSRYKD